MPTEPLFASDGEVDPIYEQSLPPRELKQTEDGEYQPLKPHEELVLCLLITAGTICVLWGAWHLWRWFVRLALG